MAEPFSLSKFLGQIEHTGQTFASPLVEEQAAKMGGNKQLLNEFGQPLTKVPTTAETMGGLETIQPKETPQISHEAEVPPTSELRSLESEQTTPPNLEGYKPNFEMGQGSPIEYQGPVKPGQAMVPYKEPATYLPPVSETSGPKLEGPLGKFTPEEREGFLSRNKGKIAAGAGLGAVGYNLMGGPGSSEQQMKTPGVGIPKKEEKPEEEDETSEEGPSGGKKAPGVSIPLGSTPQRGLQGMADMLTPQTQNYKQGLENAQQGRNQAILAAQLGKAGVQIGASVARVKPEDTSILDTAIKQADNVVKDYEEKIAMEKKDPNSEYSKGLQKYLKSMYGVDTNASAEAISNTMLKPLETMYENQQKAKNHKEEMALKYQELAHAKNATAIQKAQHDQDSTTFKVQQQLETARSQPGITQAEKDLYAIRKVDSMVNLYGDPNKLNPQQFQLLASEVAKIAKGGTPDTQELRGLNQQTLPSKLAHYAQMVVNEPIPANMGAFATAMQDYTTSLKKDAQSVIKEKYGRVLESNKKQLGDSNYQTLKSNYMGRFPEVTENKQQDPQIAKWAKEHSLDYNKAEAIINSRKQGQ